MSQTDEKFDLSELARGLGRMMSPETPSVLPQSACPLTSEEGCGYRDFGPHCEICVTLGKFFGNLVRYKIWPQKTTTNPDRSWVEMIGSIEEIEEIEEFKASLRDRITVDFLAEILSEVFREVETRDGMSDEERGEIGAAWILSSTFERGADNIQPPFRQALTELVDKLIHEVDKA